MMMMMDDDDDGVHVRTYQKPLKVTKLNVFLYVT